MHFQEKARIDKEAEAARARENATNATAALEVCVAMVRPVKDEIRNDVMDVNTARYFKQAL